MARRGDGPRRLREAGGGEAGPGRPGRRRRDGPDVPAGGAARLQPSPRQHRPRLRPRPHRGAPRHRHGARPRQEPPRGPRPLPGAERPLRPSTRGERRASDLPRPRLRPPPRRRGRGGGARAPRRLAPQHPRLLRGGGEAHRLRDRAGAGVGEPDRPGDAEGEARLHGARAGERRPGRRPGRPLRAGRRALGDVHRAAPLRARHRRRDAPGAHRQRPRPAALLLERGGAPRARRHRHGGPGAGPGPAHRHRRRGGRAARRGGTRGLANAGGARSPSPHAPPLAPGHPVPPHALAGSPRGRRGAPVRRGHHRHLAGAPPGSNRRVPRGGAAPRDGRRGGLVGGHASG